MTEHAMIEQIAHAIMRIIPVTIPLDEDYWDYDAIGKRVKRDAATVREKWACLPSFPSARILPSAGSRGAQPLYKATEVIEWIEKHKRK